MVGKQLNKVQAFLNDLYLFLFISVYIETILTAIPWIVLGPQAIPHQIDCFTFGSDFQTFQDLKRQAFHKITS